ncbi:uncharacterized protein C8A04DRAFT_38250 [Dichotomopilus funicola]|uniref:Anaphase-promoting complex subunit 13 n=1 Tax=Dichotomopilus funicola TaxID=1934379 RepID=A0AAN6V0C1_9PEZI|nr:hypothetical protein C8A04DRAFT_38250 [Dichotomopilus funicola]
MQRANNNNFNVNVPVNVNNRARSASTDSTWTLTPPQSRIPLSSSASTITEPKEWFFKIPIHPARSARAPISANMNKDGCFTHVHMHKSMHADLFEEFCKDKLPHDDIYVPPDLQPINPEEEDDVVPDQHAAYGVQKATQKAREPAWKDLGLSELLARGPTAGSVPKRLPGGRRRGGGAGTGSQYQGLPR